MTATKECTIAVGVQILLARKDKLITSLIYEVQISDADKQSVVVGSGTEVGMKLGIKAQSGDLVFSLRDQTIATAETLPFEPIQDDDVDFDEDISPAETDFDDEPSLADLNLDGSDSEVPDYEVPEPEESVPDADFDPNEPFISDK